MISSSYLCSHRGDKIRVCEDITLEEKLGFLKLNYNGLVGVNFNVISIS